MTDARLDVSTSSKSRVVLMRTNYANATSRNKSKV